MKRLLLNFITLLLFMGSNFINAQVGTLEHTLEIYKVDGYAVPYQNGIVIPSFEKQNRKMFDLGGTWKKMRAAADDDITMSKRDSVGYANLINESDGKYLKDFDDSAWEDKVLPSVENEMHVYPTVPEFFYDGVWYRRKFEIAKSDSNKFAKLVFMAANYVADVWINGKYVGYHEGGYTPFAFDVSSLLQYGDTNSIAVRIDLINWGDREDVIPHHKVDWFNYGGILQDVYLEFSNKTSVVRSDVTPLDIDGNVSIKTIIQNKNVVEENVNVLLQVFEAKIDSSNIATEFSYELADSETNNSIENTLAIPSDSILVWKTNFHIDNPKIWTPKDPNLYILKISLLQNSEVIDEFSTQFGIRTVNTEGNKFLLNNRIVFLTGTARHEDHPVYGRSLPKSVIFNDLNIIKSLKVNFLRTAHYPNLPYTYMILDRLGITAMEEIPLWQVDTENPWLIQNNIRKMHLQMFREMVYKDYNRPSIILWSTSNECHDSSAAMVYNKEFYLQMVKDDKAENYNDGRLISQSPAADNPGPSDHTQNIADIAGWTMYFGIFHGSTYFGGTFNFLNQAKTNFPNKPILDTEFGYWSSENNSTQNEQVNVANETFKAFKWQAALNNDGSLNENGPLMACTWWCAFDWYSSFQPRGYQSMGLYTMDRQTAKPVATTIKTLYTPYYNMDGILTSVESKNNYNGIPNSVEIKQNYPNPFNPTTTLEYSLLENSKVKISLFNMIGQEVGILLDTNISKGNHRLIIDGNNLASGIYVCKIIAESKNYNVSKSIKITHIK